MGAPSNDPQALYDYVYFHVVPSPETIYSGIRKLQPAQYLLFDGRRPVTGYFWIPEFQEEESDPVDLIREQLLPLLRQAVRRCQPDAHTGCFLSGGIDSSTVSGITAELLDKPVSVFAAGFAAPGYGELPYARLVAGHFGLDLRECRITAEDAAHGFSAISKEYDEPFGNPSAIAALYCSRVARRAGVNVLLAGDGGDEIFVGNDFYVRLKLLGYYEHIPPVLRRHVIEPLACRIPARSPLRKLRRYVEQARVAMPERTQTYNLMFRTPPDRLFVTEFLKGVDVRRPVAIMEEAYRRPKLAPDLNRLLYLDWKRLLADNDLRRTSRMAELAGVEVRYPMLDDDLVDYSLRVPAKAKFRRLELRSFFKEGVRGFLPDATLKKPKHGFGLPLGVWLNSSPELRAAASARLRALQSRGLFRVEYLTGLLDPHSDARRDFRCEPERIALMIWVLATLEEWLERHHVNP